jgi:DNA-directed RNA polymerase subunit K/omega
VTFVPEALGKFTFVRLASLRAAQLIRGCTPRVEAAHKATTTAQREVMEGKVCEGPESRPMD